MATADSSSGKSESNDSLGGFLEDLDLDEAIAEEARKWTSVDTAKSTAKEEDTGWTEVRPKSLSYASALRTGKPVPKPIPTSNKYSVPPPKPKMVAEKAQSVPKSNASSNGGQRSSTADVRFVEILGIPESVSREVLYKALQQIGCIRKFYFRPDQSLATVLFYEARSMQKLLTEKDWFPYGGRQPIVQLMDPAKEASIRLHAQRKGNSSEVDVETHPNDNVVKKWSNPSKYGAKLYEPVCEIAISNIPTGTDRETVYSFFSKFGQIKRFDFVSTQAHVFVTYYDWKSVESVREKTASQAWLPFKGQKKPLAVDLSPAAWDSLQIFVGGLLKSVAEKSLREFFHGFGPLKPQGGVEVRAGLEFNYAFITYTNPTSVAKALEHAKANAVSFAGKIVDIRAYDPSRKLGGAPQQAHNSSFSPRSEGRDDFEESGSPLFPDSSRSSSPASSTPFPSKSHIFAPANQSRPIFANQKQPQLSANQNPPKPSANQDSKSVPATNRNSGAITTGDPDRKADDALAMQAILEKLSQGAVKLTSHDVPPGFTQLVTPTKSASGSGGAAPKFMAKLNKKSATPNSQNASSSSSDIVETAATVLNSANQNAPVYVNQIAATNQNSSPSHSLGGLGTTTTRLQIRNIAKISSAATLAIFMQNKRSGGGPLRSEIRFEPAWNWAAVDYVDTSAQRVLEHNNDSGHTLEGVQLFVSSLPPVSLRHVLLTNIPTGFCFDSLCLYLEARSKLDIDLGQSRLSACGTRGLFCFKADFVDVGRLDAAISERPPKGPDGVAWLPDREPVPLSDAVLLRQLPPENIKHEDTLTYGILGAPVMLSAEEEGINTGIQRVCLNLAAGEALIIFEDWRAAKVFQSEPFSVAGGTLLSPQAFYDCVDEFLFP